MPRDYLVLDALRSCGDGPKRGWGLLRAESRGVGSVWALGQTGPRPGQRPRKGAMHKGVPMRRAKARILAASPAGLKEPRAPPAGPRRQLSGPLASRGKSTHSSARPTPAHAAPTTAVSHAFHKAAIFLVWGQGKLEAVRGLLNVRGPAPARPARAALSP
jgi:hypothetical protein